MKTYIEVIYKAYCCIDISDVPEEHGIIRDEIESISIRYDEMTIAFKDATREEVVVNVGGTVEDLEINYKTPSFELLEMTDQHIVQVGSTQDGLLDLSDKE